MSYDPHKVIGELQAKVWRLESQLSVAVQLLADAGRGEEVEAAFENATVDPRTQAFWEFVLRYLYEGGGFRTRSGVADLATKYGVQITQVSSTNNFQGGLDAEVSAYHMATRADYSVRAIVRPDAIYVNDISVHLRIP